MDMQPVTCGGFWAALGKLCLDSEFMNNVSKRTNGPKATRPSTKDSEALYQLLNIDLAMGLSLQEIVQFHVVVWKLRGGEDELNRRSPAIRRGPLTLDDTVGLIQDRSQRVRARSQRQDANYSIECLIAVGLACIDGDYRKDLRDATGSADNFEKALRKPPGFVPNNEDSKTLQALFQDVDVLEAMEMIDSQGWKDPKVRGKSQDYCAPRYRFARGFIYLDPARLVYEIDLLRNELNRVVSPEKALAQQRLDDLARYVGLPEE